VSDLKGGVGILQVCGISLLKEIVCQHQTDAILKLSPAFRDDDRIED